jgi:hypothetical protein
MAFVDRTVLDVTLDSSIRPIATVAGKLVFTVRVGVNAVSIIYSCDSVRNLAASHRHQRRVEGFALDSPRCSQGRC